MSQMHPSIREVAVLQQATQMILSSLDADTVLHHILLIVRNYFGASRCAVYLKDPSSNELYCRAQNGFDEATQQQRLLIGEESIAGAVALTRAPLYVADVTKESRRSRASTGSELALPLLVRERTLGVLDISSDKVDPFGSDAIGLLSVFAGQAAIALENTRLHSTELRRMRQMELLNLIARSAAAAHDTPQFFLTLADLVSDTFDGIQSAIILTHADGSLSVPAQAGAAEAPLERFMASAREGALAQVLAQRTAFVMEDVQARPGWVPCYAGTRSEMCVPMVSFNESLGAILLAHPQARFFAPDDRFIAQAAADVCATAARNVQLSEELRRVVTIDPMTGSFNQRHFHNAVGQEIPRASRTRKGFALLALDVKGMREVNAVLGMDGGDKVLKDVATRLKSALRNNDTLCRYVGDRFTVLLPEVEAQGMAVVLAKLKQALSGITVEAEGASRPMGATWASVQFPQDAQTEQDLAKLLFVRLEKAKREEQRAAGAGA